MHVVPFVVNCGVTSLKYNSNYSVKRNRFVKLFSLATYRTQWRTQDSEPGVHGRENTNDFFESLYSTRDISNEKLNLTKHATQ